MCDPIVDPIDYRAIECIDCIDNNLTYVCKFESNGVFAFLTAGAQKSKI